MDLKQEIHFRYTQQVQDKIDACTDFIRGLTVDAQNDAKGSAGNKHETALSMMHLEQEKSNQKLLEFYAQKAILTKINPAEKARHVGLGSVVRVNQLLLFMSTALPKIVVEQETVFAISPQSPLGSQIHGKSAGYCFELDGKSYTIHSVE
jgi:transcription elongation GreA/GreB family factor